MLYVKKPFQLKKEWKIKLLPLLGEVNCLAMLSKKTLTSSIALDPIERIWKSSLNKNSCIRSKICNYKKVTHLNQAIRAIVTHFNPFSNIFSKIKRYKKFKNLGELIAKEEEKSWEMGKKIQKIREKKERETSQTHKKNS